MVLFGPPGAGKGTQAQLLTQQLAVRHISSGGLFRHHLQNKTPLGLRAAGYMDQGLLVPDELTIDIVLQRVLSLNTEQGFILDGFPRNRTQAEALAEALSRRSRNLDRVVYISVPEPELIRRLGGRFTCRQCQAPHTLPESHTAVDLECPQCGGELYQRPDDGPGPVRTRIQVYQEQTLPLLDYYRELGILVEISGADAVDEVNRGILAALDRVPKLAKPE